MNVLLIGLFVVGVSLVVVAILQRPRAKRRAAKEVVLPPPMIATPKGGAVDEAPPRIEYEEDEESEPTRMASDVAAAVLGDPSMEKIVVDEDALLDEPTKAEPLIRLEATARTHSGLWRKRNEDRVLARDEDELFVVADGMGGEAGGEIASELAVDAIARAFDSRTFPGVERTELPRRAAELARAIQAANVAILARAQSEKPLAGMGTTLCAVRFAAKKQRLYVGHVGDSRVYRLRDGRLQQMTADHTMRGLGVRGEGADHLSRVLGIAPNVSIDLLFGKPEPGDVYLLCSDGLTRMVDDEQIRDVLLDHPSPDDATEELVRLANESGGKDNISVVLIRVEPAETRLAG